ncbi:MAG TPA: nitroreductase family deazaflavin-dependent oxidoreductase [Acidothermaceae bacterium]
MTITNEWNAKIVADFRENEGRVGGNFEGAPITILHHVGRKSGREYLAPVMYLPADDNPDTIYVFASAGGAPVHPKWYDNMIAAGTATVEVGTQSYPVTVTDVTGAERDRVYAEQVKRYPGFGEYESKNVGIRTIPVLKLTRA